MSILTWHAGKLLQNVLLHVASMSEQHSGYFGAVAKRSVARRCRTDARQRKEVGVIIRRKTGLASSLTYRVLAVNSRRVRVFLRGSPEQQLTEHSTNFQHSHTCAFDKFAEKKVKL